jgi:hypothetical protein
MARTKLLLGFYLVINMATGAREMFGNLFVPNFRIKIKLPLRRTLQRFVLYWSDRPGLTTIHFTFEF